MLDFAQRYTAQLDCSSVESAHSVLERTNAFIDPYEADTRGIRLTLPSTIVAPPQGGPMPLAFENLDERTRRLMVDEVDRDLAGRNLYESPRLTAAGAASWETLFRTACETGNDSLLAAALGAPGGAYINAREPNPRSRTGGDKAVPYNAATTMAEGEFNRFYIRAMCVRALEDGVGLEIYRARASENPDPESEAKIGQSPDTSALLDDLRSHQGVATALGLPPHPNSGLSVRLSA